jgi:hypothetical protein
VFSGRRGSFYRATFVRDCGARRSVDLKYNLGGEFGKLAMSLPIRTNNEPAEGPTL